MPIYKEMLEINRKTTLRGTILIINYYNIF